MNEQDPLLDVPQVAELLGVRASMIYDKWRSWELPAVRFGKLLRFRRSEVEAWIDQQRVA
jgi:excisionase family DNA binding protein